MKKIMRLNGNSNSDMEELAKKTTNGDLAELANFMNDFFLSVSDHLPRLDKDLMNLFTCSALYVCIVFSMDPLRSEIKLYYYYYKVVLLLLLLLV